MARMFEETTGIRVDVWRTCAVLFSCRDVLGHVVLFFVTTGQRDQPRAGAPQAEVVSCGLWEEIHVRHGVCCRVCRGRPVSLLSSYGPVKPVHMDRR